ncbi:hypothetical protein LUZ60_001843 [Juncus effusus]|nr:hypothetical protein LUZ60_001843 [Juncus effusus]
MPNPKKKKKLPPISSVSLRPELSHPPAGATHLRPSRRRRLPPEPQPPSGRRPKPPQPRLLRELSMVQFKNRYLVMEVFVDPNRETGESDPIVLSSLNISKAIKDSLQLNFGECGLASCLGSFQVKYVNHVTKLCVIRASRDAHQKVWAAITLVRTIGRCPVSFNLLDLSGSIKACKRAALECDEAKFEQYKLVAGDKVTPEIENSVKNNFEKIKLLEN